MHPTTRCAQLVKLAGKKLRRTFLRASRIRIARLALRRAWKGNRTFGPALLKAAIAEVEPSPLMDVGRLQ